MCSIIVIKFNLNGRYKKFSAINELDDIYGNLQQAP